MTSGEARYADLYGRLLRCWPVETGRHWRAENPAPGQCSVTALVVRDVLGGEILKTEVNGAGHFYNAIGGRRVDFTASQFAGPIGYDDSPSDRAEALADTTPDYYRLLRKRVTTA